MTNYDFKSLSAFDFENLVRDLLQKELNLRLECFKSGRDGGIDLRYSIDNTNSIVVQCKHYASSSFGQLKSSLKKEVPKVEKLQPSRYVIATSLGLTPQNKAEIKELFEPYCLNLGDIYGNSDLNNLLGYFPEVEKHNYKLWLTSSEVLENIFHSQVYNQSQFEIDWIIQKTKLYVQTDSYFKAKEILKESNYCIITGIPGIGKTSLAEIILLDYISKSFEILKIYEMKEAYEVFDPNKKQVFYYDDFLGQTSLESKLEKNEDVKISRFINEINRYNNTYFILTTRDYILNQAQSAYEALERTDFDSGKCVLKLQDISTLARARILYNHIYFSDIDSEYVKSIIQDKNYLKIINHKNYNPRIVEWMTTKKLDINGQYIDCFLDFLNNPIKIWEHAFENQLSDSSKNLLLVLSTLPNSVLHNNLKVSFESYNEIKSEKFGFTRTMDDFKKALKELEGTFLTIIKHNSNNTTVQFHNPSIKDFIENSIVNNPEKFLFLCNSSVFFEQCKIIWRLLNNKRFSKGNSQFNFSLDFVQALERNFDSKPLPVFPHFHSISTQMYEDNASSNYENRLNFILDVAIKTNDKKYSKLISDLIHLIINSLNERQVDKNELILLSKKMNDSNFGYGISKDEFISKIKAYMLDYYYLEEFDFLQNFMSIFPKEITHEEYCTIKDDFLSYCEYDCQQDILDGGSVEDGIYLLESISQGFNIDMSDEIEEIEKELYSIIGDTEPEYDDYDQWRDSELESSSEESDDETIERMFSSL